MRQRPAQRLGAESHDLGGRVRPKIRESGEGGFFLALSTGQEPSTREHVARDLCKAARDAVFFRPQIAGFFGRSQNTRNVKP
jgi:hypothetical protein